MTHRNKTFFEKSIQDLSNNIKECSNSVKKCCKITYEKMHRNLVTNNRFKKIQYRNLNYDYSSLYYENDDETDYNLDFSILDSNNMFVYTGNKNVWFSRKNALFFSNVEENTINLVKAKVGYVLIARSFNKENVEHTKCYNLNGKRLKQNSKVNVGDILQCKLTGWKNTCLCCVKAVKHIEGMVLLNLSFPSCPESEIVLGWHFNSTIQPNKTLIEYNLPIEDEYRRELSPIMEETEETTNSIAAFLVHEEENEIISGSNIGNSKINDSNKIYSSNFFRNSNDNEILKYNVFWLSRNNYKNKFFKKKQVVISSYNHVNNIYTNGLSNVKIINDYHMKNILNLHQRSYNSLKILRTNFSDNILSMVEPQTYDFFKYNKNRHRIIRAMESGMICTYTGPLARKAKEYLFNIY